MEDSAKKTKVAKKTARVRKAPQEVAQKAVKKATKKTTSKKATKKVVSPKKSSQKETESIHKVHIIHLSSHARAEKIKIGVNRELAKAKPVSETQPKPASVLAKPEKRELALLSPFRFPVDNDKLAAQTARFAGVVLVLIGALFTMFYAQFIDPTFRLEGMTASTIATTEVIETTTGTLSPVTGAIDTAPAVLITVESPSPLSGKVRVSYAVTGAQKVEAHAFYKDEQRNVRLGNANKVSDDRWIYEWDTKQYPDGVYKMRVIVTNQYGQYEKLADTYVTVKNMSEPVKATATTTENKTTDTSTTTDNGLVEIVEDNLPVISGISIFTNASDPAIGTIKLMSKTSGFTARDVKVYALSSATGKNEFLGNALSRSSGEWAFDWDTRTVADGVYKVTAVGLLSTMQYVSDPVLVSVQNASAEVTKTSTTTEIVATVPVLTIPESNPITGGTDLLITAKDATYIELYAKPALSGTQRFLGVAAKQDATRWRLVLDTTSVPNGAYEVFARVRTPYNVQESNRVSITIKNELALKQTEEEKARIEEVKAMEQKVALVEQTLKLPVTETASTELDDGDERVPLEGRAYLLDLFEDEVEYALKLLSVAIRSGDASQIERARQYIAELKVRMLAAAQHTDGISGEISELENELSAELLRMMKETERRELVIKERVGEDVFKDSDQDGISDYDEVNIYETDPFSADTDGDGFLDGHEVLQGFDPRSDEPETKVAYESPREVGIERPDLLSVDHIVALTPDESDEMVTGVLGSALISGKGLPNSFVTLYIFSTPIIVTVKTEADGSWQYTFDRELEDGDHEIYVGVTDNAGRIVAKSSPFRFVKTAEAFSPIGGSASVPLVAENVSERTLFSQNILYLVLSVTIVALGLVLMLLGIYVERRPHIAKLAIE